MPIFTSFSSSSFFIGAATSATVPSAPTIGSATSVNGSTVSVSFTAPGFDGGSPITSYTAVSSPSGITGTISQSGSGSITVTGLTSGTAYTFTVYATNSVGNSPSSSNSNSVTPTAATVGSILSGKLNISIPTALTNAGSTGASARDSSGSMFKSYGNSTINTAAMVVFDSSNTITSGTKLTTARTYLSSSGVAYTAGSNIYCTFTEAYTANSQYHVTFAKFYSNTALQWQKRCTYSTATTANDVHNNITTAGGNVYWVGGTSAPSPTNGLISSWTESGASNWVANISYTSTSIMLEGISSDGTYLYIAGTCIYPAYYTAVFAKLVQSGGQSWTKELYYSTSNVNTVKGFGSASDGTNSYFVGEASNTGMIVAFSSSGTVLWKYSYPEIQNFYACVVVSGYLYAVGRTTGGVAMCVKINTSNGSVVSAFTSTEGGIFFMSVYYDSNTHRLVINSSTTSATLEVPVDFSAMSLPQLGLSAYSVSTTTNSLLVRNASLLVFSVGYWTNSTDGTLSQTTVSNPSYSGLTWTGITGT